MNWTLGRFSLIMLFAGFNTFSEGTLEDNRWLNTDKDDVIFIEDVTFNVTVRSRIDCARLCSISADCITFTSTEAGKGSVSCRGHSSAMESGSLTSAAPGTKGFIRRSAMYSSASSVQYMTELTTLAAEFTKHSTELTEPTTASAESTTKLTEQTTMLESPTSLLDTSPGIGKACVDNHNCSTEAGVECFIGECLCTPGFYYSVSSKVCVETCAQNDLYPAFLMYPNSGMTDNNDEMHIFTTREECRALCLNLDDCRGYEYSQPALKACNLQTTTPLDDLAAFDRGTDEGWEFYQRMCA